MSIADLQYFQKLPDFEDIKEYLDLDDMLIEDPSAEEFDLPQFKPDFSTSIIVDNLPMIPKDKVDKLLGVLKKMYTQINANITDNDIYMPFNEEAGTTHGFCFIKFPKKEDAENAIKVTNGYQIDKKHTFNVTMYTNLDQFGNIPDEYVAPPPPVFIKRPDPKVWLTDKASRDQFVVRSGTETQIFWANYTGEEPTMIYGGEKEKVDGKVWCDNYVCWSPQGTYLATFHVPGIKLWGGDDFASHNRFMHQKVEDVSFSPCENYLITYRTKFQHPSVNPAEAIIVWDVRSGVKLRQFELKNNLDVKCQVQATVSIVAGEKTVEKVIRGRVKAYQGDSSSGVFTIEEGSTTHENVDSDKVIAIQEQNWLKWSSDGKYVARLGCDIISVYELPSMVLLERKSIAAKDVLDFVWSPKSNMISYWSPAVANHPALINIIKIPDRTDLCSRKLFDVSDGRMVWQNEGDYLCVHMTKMQGKKKSYVLMFFRVRDAGIPVEQLELTEPILHVSWEPSGDRLVIMSGEARAPSIAFYSMSGTKVTAVANRGATTVASRGATAARQELTHLFTKTGTQCNEIIWSPSGGFAALAFFAPDTCIFELHDVENNVTMATRRHERCNKLLWDPSGRFIVSYTSTDLRNSSARGHSEDGFNVYTFQGQIVSQTKREKIFQWLWRPRPKDLLTSEDKKAVIKNLKKHEKDFEREDKIRKQELHQEIQAQRFKLAEEFLTIVKNNKLINSSLRPLRVEIRDGYDSDDDRNYKIEVTTEETIISSKDQVMQ